MTAPQSVRVTLPLSVLFRIFLRAGFAFGGGVAILAVLQDELVDRRKLLSKQEFFGIYAVGRITPSGTMTALAIAYGHRFHGFVGGLVAIAGLFSPALGITLGATWAYASLHNSSLMTAASAILAPAAIALVVAAAFKLGSDVMKQRIPVLVALGAFAASLVGHVNPALVLLAGGALGAWLLSPPPETPPESP